MTEESRHISVIEPVSVALERVKEVLLRPFDFPRWLAIGFCAWLAYLGEGGISNFNYRANNNRNFSQIPSEVANFVNENWPLVIAIGAVVLILIIAVSIVFSWLRSRGQFMFLHCIANNEAGVELPWNQYSKEGNRLFVFKLIAGIISFFVIAFFVVAIIIFALLIVERGISAVAGVTCLIPAVLLFICAAIVMAIFFKFTTDFVVPIMYLRRCGPAEGWRIFLVLLSSNKGEFFLYILFQIVLSIIIFAIRYIAPCCLCCFAGCCVMVLLALPYVWAVVLLPVLAFSRSYSLYYLRQFGPEFDVFIPKSVVPLPQV